MVSSRQRHPVIVVGGGIAGLTAAWELEQRGVHARVYEATPRVGGRIHSLSHQGVLETGMQFYYSSYKRAFHLLRHFGLDDQLVPIHVQGRMVHNGEIARFDKAFPWLRLLSASDNLRLQSAVARQLPALLRLTPFDYDASDPLDAIDSAAYFHALGGPEVVELAIRPMVTSYAFCEPEGHSLAVLLRLLRLGAMSKMYGLRGGNDGLPRALAQQLDVVHAGVRQILVDDGRVEGVVIEDGDGPRTIGADHVICAVRGSQAGALLPGAPALASAFDELSYSNILLVNLYLDHALTGPDWTYVHSRGAGHRAAFAVDLTRRSPAMFPDARSVLQVVFAEPQATRLMGESDARLGALAADQMEVFLPGVGGHVRESSVVRRVRALPNFRCGMFQQVRTIQGMARQIPGLHLAGDYLRAPLCEGAVRSGDDAAAEVLSDIGALEPAAQAAK